MSNSLRSQFMLDPDVIFLNHGSFGACPRPVFEVYQRWQRELERQPVLFMARRVPSLLAEARGRLAAHLGVESADHLVYFTNPTTALNMVARSLAMGDHSGAPRLRAGDEILATDHEYPALDNTWDFIARHTGARYVRRPIPLPITSAADFVENFWAGVTGRTKVIFLSHITSPTALIFPVQEICRRARAAGLISIVDGAHAPGQIALNLAEVGADVYVGACHKWLCAPKGSAFLYARPEVHAWLEPLVVSLGWGRPVPEQTTALIAYHEWQGTRDLAAFLTVPAAIEFQEQNDWPAVRRRCHDLAGSTRRRINALTGLDPLCPDSAEWFGQMASVRLPAVDPDQLGRRLYEEYHIEVPLMQWNGRPLLRVSFQAYNNQADADALVDALARLLPTVAT